MELDFIYLFQVSRTDVYNWKEKKIESEVEDYRDDFETINEDEINRTATAINSPEMLHAFFNKAGV